MSELKLPESGGPTSPCRCPAVQRASRFRRTPFKLNRLIILSAEASPVEKLSTFRSTGATAPSFLFSFPEAPALPTAQPTRPVRLVYSAPTVIAGGQTTICSTEQI